jgi:putative DNA primase/helicase
MKHDNFNVPEAENGDFKVTNAEFLRVVFEGIGDNVNWITAFDEPPKPGAPWGGHKRKPDSVPDYTDKNAYFSIAAFPSSATSREKKQIERVYCLVVDDFKSDLDLEPTWIIQTSRHSRQVGYRLSEPVANEKAYTAVLRGIKAIPGADPNGNGAVRWVRLPNAINNKKEHGETFRCHLVAWNPENAYTLEEVETALHGEIRKHGLYEPEKVADDDGVVEPRHDAFKNRQSDYDLIQLIVSGQSYHDPLRDLSFRRIRNGQSYARTVEEIKGYMNEVPKELLSDPAQKERWQNRYSDIERMVQGAVDRIKPFGVVLDDDTIDDFDDSILWSLPELDGTGESMPDLNDDEKAIRLSQAGFNARARFVPGWKRWMLWDGSVWRESDTEYAETQVRSFLRAQANQVKSWAMELAKEVFSQDQKKAAAIRRWGDKEASKMRQGYAIRSVETTARSNSELLASVDQWDQNLDLMGTPGGTVDLKTGRLLKPSPQHFITRSTSVTPAAEGEHSMLWDQTILRICGGSVEMAQFLQVVAGYCLTGHTSEHKLFFMYGSGRNGKSTFIDVIEHMMQDYAVKAPEGAFLASNSQDHPTGIAKLRGARMVSASELAENRSWNEQLIKEFTGGDTMTGRYMYGNFFDFKPQCTILIAGNTQPKMRTTDVAMRARMVLIPFTVRIPDEEIDPHLMSKLVDEMPKIMRWAIDGAVMWYQSGCKMKIPDFIAQASEEYLDEEDVIGNFLADSIDYDDAARTAFKDVYDRYLSWSRENGITHPITSRNFSRDMKKRGLQTYLITGNAKGYRGIKLRDIEQSKTYSMLSNGS